MKGIRYTAGVKCPLSGLTRLRHISRTFSLCFQIPEMIPFAFYRGKQYMTGNISAIFRQLA